MDVVLSGVDENILASARRELNEGKLPASFGTRQASDGPHADGSGNRVLCDTSGLFHYWCGPHEFIRPHGPPTGEPDAGNPPVRFGGRGGRKASPYPYTDLASPVGDASDGLPLRLFLHTSQDEEGQLRMT